MTTTPVNIALRKARLSDLPVLQHWDKQAHVIAAAPHETWDWESDIRNASPYQELLIAERNSQPIGVMQIIDPALEETHYWGDVPANLKAIDIWIGEASNLGKGYGTQMMQLALERCFQSPKVKGILIDPLDTNKRAHKFYESIGFEFLEHRTFEQDYCRVYYLSKEKWLRSSSRKT